MTTATTTHRCTATAFLVLAILPACAGLERRVTLVPGDRVVVELVQPPGGEITHAVTRELRQSLCSEAVLGEDKIEFYSSPRSDPLAKIVATDRMQILLDAFATAGFYDHASERELTSGSTRLRVTHNEATLCWTRVPSMSDADRSAFMQCWSSFLELYNATPAYRASTGADAVLEQHRLQRESRGVVR